jgi:hypothetical protein
LSVGREDNFLGTLPNSGRYIIQPALEAEQADHLGRRHYERREKE